MNKKKIYVSLPMTGYDEESIVARVADATRRLEHLGYDAVSALDNGLPRGAAYEAHMKADLRMMLDCDAVYMCEGHEHSRGCRAERRAATACGLTVLSQHLDDGRIRCLMDGRTVAEATEATDARNGKITYGDRIYFNTESD